MTTEDSPPVPPKTSSASLTATPVAASDGRQDAIDALSEVWAGIDGNGNRYRACRDALRKGEDEYEAGGYYSGYQTEAKEMLDRLAKKGFILTRILTK